MAFYDDPRFLLSHIRNSYITSDDTGVCEMVMVNENCPAKQTHQPSLHPSWTFDSSDSGLESDTTELSQSYDIASDMDYALRRRSNTAQRLDKLKKERKSQAKIKNIQWRSPDSFLSVEEMSELFEKKANTIPKEKPRKKSLLSEQLEKFPTLPNNPFGEYAKFDGSAYIGIPTKKLNIYLTMLTTDERAFPMTVITIITAKVQELIGLICWQYTNNNRKPELKDNADYYSLCIAEENGEVDLDFPNLDPKEAISKFGFTDLALVEKDLSEKPPSDQIIVTVNIFQGGFSKIPVTGKDVTMREILDSTLRRRRGMMKAKGLEYQLEKESEPGVAVDLDSTLAMTNTLDFYLVRANSKREDDPKEPWQPKELMVMEAPRYLSYRVFLIRKLLHKSEIHLGISVDKIEIDPVQQKGSVKFWAQPQKPITHDIDTIAACELLELKYNAKLLFRLTYKSDNSHDYKHHDFETEGSEAKEIVEKICHNLELRMSSVRRDYLAQRERKSLRRSLLQSSFKASSKH
uniref:Target of rapamycin complex 2 subunit MAPKAP1 n=1 Tax=Strigamia maritima TaxID=126957 RepID=T1J7R6_STRMM